MLARRARLHSPGEGEPVSQVLVVCVSELLVDTLRVLRAAGLEVTVLCSRKILNRLGRSYDHWLAPECEKSGECEEYALIRQAAALLAVRPQAYDWVLLTDDSLLAALREIALDLGVKLRLSPLRSAASIGLLHSKRETARFLRENGFSCPRSASCDSFDEIVQKSHEIGFPTIIKIEGTNGGKGTFRADSADELSGLRPALANKQVVIEQFLDGPEAAIEALYLSGELVAYNFSYVMRRIGRFGSSYERRFQPCASVASALIRLGRLLQLNCFTNISCIADPRSDTHFFFEVDLRPNAWVSFGQLVGVDFSNVIRRFIRQPDRHEPVASTSIERMLAHFERDVRYSLARGDWRRVWAWVINRNNCWDAAPFDDWKLMRQMARRHLQDILSRRL